MRSYFVCVSFALFIDSALAMPSNPNDGTAKAECLKTSACADNLACINQRCVDPCAGRECGTGAHCTPKQHIATCSCPPGVTGDPLVECYTACSKTSDCASNQACVNKICKNPCLGRCALNAFCKAVNHAPLCSCLPGLTGDAFIRCSQIFDHQ